eukprot:comp20828_c0_seq1/m.43120 comp20828_c0_seq1/g.43120  ORF comp20828_c0_seq1/g.43120 comp20828_c0_seq1/m.43120 type:complete len:354 (+) comp20828_c0_seq1:216-1277(+)
MTSAVFELVVSACLSGAAAGLVAVLVTVAIEKFGGGVGGIIATLPSTIIPASLAIAWQSTGDLGKLEDAMFAVPIGLMVNAFFLWSWRVVPERLPETWSSLKSLLVMVAVSLSLWLVLSATVVASLLKLGHGSRMITGWVCMGINFAAGVYLAFFHPLPAPAGSRPVPRIVLFFRSLLAGAAIFLSVILSRINATAAGIMSTFPAIFMTTMVSLWISQGENVPTGAVGPMMFGSVSPSLYAVFFFYTLQYMGQVATAMVAGILVSICYSVPAAIMISKKKELDADKEIRDFAESVDKEFNNDDDDGSDPFADIDVVTITKKKSAAAPAVKSPSPPIAAATSTAKQKSPVKIYP